MPVTKSIFLQNLFGYLHVQQMVKMLSFCPNTHLQMFPALVDSRVDITLVQTMFSNTADPCLLHVLLHEIL